MVARRAHAPDCRIAIEWPRRCKYWKRPEVRELLSKLDINLNAICSECEVGLVEPKSGKPIQRDWRIATDDIEIHAALSRRKCSHAPSEHAKLEGKMTKASENYTPDLVDTIHQAWRKSVAKSAYTDSRRTRKSKVASANAAPVPQSAETGLSQGGRRRTRQRPYQALPCRVEQSMDV